MVLQCLPSSSGPSSCPIASPLPLSSLPQGFFGVLSPFSCANPPEYKLLQSSEGQGNISVLNTPQILLCTEMDTIIIGISLSLTSQLRKHSFFY